jgi:hypothetical protein
MPDPSAAAKKADNAMFYVWFDSTADNRLTYTLPLPVDSSTAFAFSFYFPHDNLIELSLQDPNGNQVDLEQFEIDVSILLVDNMILIFSNIIQIFYTNLIDPNTVLNRF